MTKTNEEQLLAKPSKRKRKDKKSFKTRLASIIMCGPISVWSVLFIILPIILLAFMSFMTKGPLGREMYTKLFVYAGPEHKHAAQKPEVLTF